MVYVRKILGCEALIAELSDASPRFRELWDRAEVGYRLGIYHVRHPRVGDLYLYRHRLNAPYPGGDHVIMYRAEPGSPSAQALEELRSLSVQLRTHAHGLTARSD